jgi:hypothetical protein
MTGAGVAIAAAGAAWLAADGVTCNYTTYSGTPGQYNHHSGSCDYSYGAVGRQKAPSDSYYPSIVTVGVGAAAAIVGLTIVTTGWLGYDKLSLEFGQRGAEPTGGPPMSVVLTPAGVAGAF